MKAMLFRSTAGSPVARIFKHAREVLLLCALGSFVGPAAHAAVSETPEEFHGSADINGDGVVDLIIVDKPSGIYRLAFGQANGTNLWIEGRPSGIENVTGFAAGRVLSTARDGLAFTAPGANRVNLVDASSSAQAGQPTNVLVAPLGPNRVALLDIGGAGNTAHADIFAPSIENNPPVPYRLGLVRSTGTTFSNMLDLALAARVVNTDAIKLKTNVANPVLAGSIREAGGNFNFIAQTLASGTPVDVAVVNALPPVDAFVATNFNATALCQFLFYQRGSSNLLLRPVQEPVAGAFNFGAGASFPFTSALREVLIVPGTNDIRLLIIFGLGETAGIYTFNGVDAPQVVETFTAPPGETFSGAGASGRGNFSLFSGTDGKSSKFQDWKRSGNGYVKGASGALPDLNKLSSSANVFLFANKPFVHPTPRLMSSLNAADWSSQLQTTNPAGQISVVAEQFVNSAQGLDNPTARNLGAAPAGAGFGLPNQLAASFSLVSFLPAIGNEVAEITISPKPGHFPSGVSFTLHKPDGLAALIFYRLGPQDTWKLYPNTPIPLYQDTTVSYFGYLGGNKSAIHTASYTFDVAPAQLDSDGDGVPDFVEIGLGGTDADVHNKDSDRDGYSDLAEILAGTNGAPYNASIVPTNAPRADELSAFDAAIIPNAVNGLIPGLLNCQTGTIISVYDLHGGLADVQPASLFFSSTFSYFQSLMGDAGQLFYVAITEPHFDVRTNNSAFPNGADTRVGRELLRLIPIPPLPDKLQINYTNSGGTLAQETANWVAAALAAQDAIVRPVLILPASSDDTLAALLWERKIATLLSARGVIAPTNQITFTPFRPQDAGRTNPVHATVLSLQTNLLLNTGDPDPAFPGYNLQSLFTSLNTAVTSPPTASIQELRELAAEVYRISSLSNNAAPSRYPSPVDTLRRFIAAGELHSNYLAVTSFSGADLSNAATGVAQALGGATQRPLAKLQLRVRNDSFSGPCVILETLSALPRSLVLPDGTPFKFPVAFQLVPGSEVEVWAYTDLPPTCGVPTLEVVNLFVYAIPAVSGTDEDGNLLSDAWEELFLVGDPNGDNDNDGASNFKEFLDGTDPGNAMSIGGGEEPTPPIVNIQPPQNGQLKFNWKWPAIYADKIKFDLVSAQVLGQPFASENVPAQNDGEGNFSIALPAPGVSNKFFRVQMSLK